MFLNVIERRESWRVELGCRFRWYVTLKITLGHAIKHVKISLEWRKAR